MSDVPPVGPNLPGRPVDPRRPGRPFPPRRPRDPKDPGTTGQRIPAIPPTPVVPPQVLARFGARVLDPQTAVRVPGTTVSPTVYIGDTLLVRGLPQGRAGAVVERMQKLAAELAPPIGFEIAPEEYRQAERLAQVDPDVFEQTWTTRVTLVDQSGGPAAPPDAWVILQQLRATGDLAADEVSLEHLLTAGADLTGVGGMWGSVGGMWGSVGGMWGSVGGMWGSVSAGLSIYGSPGFGGRTPVVWSAENPYAPFQPAWDAGERGKPVVALLDTGLGDHPWFRGGGITRELSVAGAVIGAVDPPAANPEYLGVVTDPFNGLIDREAGHGTFIAGIIRQRCPQAHLLPIPVMPADGAVAQGDVQRALNQLLALHRSGEQTVDVLSLSMGYYHEAPDDPVADVALTEVLRQLARAGVVVVTAAGNDATTARFLPAGFADTLRAEGLPVVSVGALNPDGHTVALFSNGGEWVTTYAPGAGIVSTVPVTLSGAMGPSIHVDDATPIPRATVDPDDYRSGFAIWSGTSFAAPWVAGEIARQIAAGADPGSAVAAVLEERVTTMTGADR